MNSEKPETVITATSTTFFRLFCTGRFTVPWHQRHYDWQSDHVDELLHDFADAITAERRCYFLGTVILVQSVPGHWRINDGQQRMVTLSLICARLLRMFNNHNDSHRAHNGASRPVCNRRTQYRRSRYRPLDSTVNASQG